MHAQQEVEIRDRAYALWQEEGSPEGRDQEFWYRAEQALAEQADVDSSEQAAEASQPTPPAGPPMH
ncbi:DUF2934 domain-containing protein [Devosia sp.]|uniref:DUF2934 domain-containing protein n=1 Tax=Devosia sp. TaxID=1871048 RepID=UPI002FCB4D50